ncbi:response regulator [Sphingomonas changnyeongensis]|uniref:Response regulator n=1 Tax=Sphingomonas changnyeongensis TaxID=2698679 RepID=A0A7Z2S8E5_9SPHN|nr:response regulator [Sphingomonas changnyeongensis]QHL89729.1 response regulator [Sphingomonas changnyeongensis]
MRSIYIIDDDDELRISLHRLLSLRSDVVIRSFASGDAFLGGADELDPGVLLLDMNMPGSSGFDVLRAIRDQQRFLAIILTGQGSIEVATKSMKAGAFDFLEKPYNYQALTEVMEGAFEKLEQESAAAARVEQARQLVSQLSARETDVLKGLIEGHANKVIAHDLQISPRTVEIYRANLMAKLKVRSLSEALKIAFAAGLFPQD